jgi:hypothetical protein
MIAQHILHIPTSTVLSRPAPVLVIMTSGYLSPLMCFVFWYFACPCVCVCYSCRILCSVSEIKLCAVLMLVVCRSKWSYLCCSYVTPRERGACTHLPTGLGSGRKWDASRCLVVVVQWNLPGHILSKYFLRFSVLMQRLYSVSLSLWNDIK